MSIASSIFQISLTGSIMFFIICIFRPFTKKVFSETWNYYMLVITILVFIVPIGSFIKLPQTISYMNYKPIQNTSKILQLSKENILQEDNESNNKQISDNNKNELKLENKDQANLETLKLSIQELEKISLIFIWILGMIIFITKEIYAYVTFHKKLKNASNIIKDKSIINTLEACKKKLNVSKKIELKECFGAKSPMITGIFTPVITIPTIDQELDKLEIILTHELIHYKRKDLWIKLIALLANVINWFNPIVYIVKNKINATCELSLDEQLIKNMDKEKRKYYGEIILEQIEYSQNKSLALGASVCKGRRELEIRLKKIVFFKKSRKLIVGISLIIAMMFTSTSLFTAKSVFAENSNSLTNNKTTEFAVFAANDELYMSELKENNPVLLDKNDKIKLPIISKDGLFVAYTKEDNLCICNIKTHEVIEVAKNVESYNWNSLGKLIYSVKNAGMSAYNIDSKNSVNLINNEYNYYNINCDSKNKIYANKSLEYTKDNKQYTKLIGIVSYDLDSKEEKVLLESKEGDGKEIGDKFQMSDLFESLGSTPNVSKISNDDRYLYIWKGAHSGSISADMTEFLVYDILNNKFVENNNMIALEYKDNISQNPVDSKLVAVNNGEGRFMYSNKTLGIYNVEDNTFKNLIPDNQISMMPNYSEDGKNIVYSGTNAVNDNEINKVSDWFNQPHYIYQVNVATKEVSQITNSNACDFMPKYLLNNEILFVRQEGDSYSLWKTNDGIETKLADSLNFNSKAYTDTWYYGHYKTEKVIDVYIG